MVKVERKTYHTSSRAIFFLGLTVAAVWALVFLTMSGRGVCVADGGRDDIDFGRGNAGRYAIFDRNFVLAATTLDLAVVYVMPPELDDIKTAAARLAPLVSMDEKQLLGMIRNENAYVRLPGYLKPAAAESIRGMHGVHLAVEPHRFYPHGTLAAHLIGFTSEGRGLAGIEALFNQELRRDRIAGEGERGNVVLSVDFDLQQRLEKELSRIRRDSGAAAAMAGVIAVNSGDILAMACVPGFDPNRFWDYDSGRVLNRFTSSRRQWPGFAGFLPAVAIGGHAALSPLSVLTALARTVNGGREMAPHLKKVMWRRDRGFFAPFAPKGMIPQVSAAVSRDFITTMNAGAENDMVFIAADRGLTLAAYYPAVGPRFALLVAMDAGPDGGGGSRGLKIMAGDILRYAATIKDSILPPDRRQLAITRAEADRRWQAAFVGRAAAPVKKKRQAGLMPDLVGMSVRRALRLVQPLGVRVRLRGSGRVMAQRPAAGRTVTADSLVSLELAVNS